MSEVREMSKEVLTAYAERNFGKLEKFLAAEPGRLDHRDLLISTVERGIEELRSTVRECRSRPELFADLRLGGLMNAVIRDFEVLEEILRRARLAGKERG